MDFDVMYLFSYELIPMEFSRLSLWYQLMLFCLSCSSNHIVKNSWVHYHCCVWNMVHQQTSKTLAFTNFLLPNLGFKVEIYQLVLDKSQLFVLWTFNSSVFAASFKFFANISFLGKGWDLYSYSGIRII